MAKGPTTRPAASTPQRVPMAQAEAAARITDAAPQPMEHQQTPVADQQIPADREPVKDAGSFQALPDDPYALGERGGRQRKPFGSHEFKLAASVPPGYVAHWINDHPGRIQRAIDGGYFHAKDKDGKPISRVVEAGPNGGGLRAYLMFIRKEWYDEDMAAQQAANDRIDQMLRGGKSGEKSEEEDEGTTYVPKDGIKFGPPVGTKRGDTRVK